MVLNKCPKKSGQGVRPPPQTGNAQIEPEFRWMALPLQYTHGVGHLPLGINALKREYEFPASPLLTAVSNDLCDHSVMKCCGLSPYRDSIVMNVMKTIQV